MAKTFLVIGAGPGISLETARRFAREGFRIVLASRHPEQLQAQLEQLRREGADVVTEVLDAGDGPKVTKLVERYGDGLDVLLYNVAVMRFGPLIDEVSADSFDMDMQINVASALRAIKAALPGMTARGSGTILLTGGAITDAPSAAALTLSIGKASLRATAQALFEPLRAHNIHIAILTIGARVIPESDTAREIAEANWTLHAAAPAQWSWEQRYVPA